MKQKRILKAIIISSAIMTPAVSMATLNIYSNEVLIQEKAQKEGEYTFTQEGLSPERTKVVQARAHNMPLSLALENITNDGWKIQVNKEAKNMPISFEGGKSWPYIMERISMDYNLRTHIDWKYRILTVYSPQQRNQAIAERREDLIKAQAQAEQDTQRNLEKAQKQYNKQQKSEYDTKKDIKQQRHHVSKEGEQSIMQILSKRYGEQFNKNIEENIKESMKQGISQKNKDITSEYEKKYEETKEKRKHDEIIKNHHKNLMQQMDYPSVEAYKEHKEEGKGFPYHELNDEAPLYHTIEDGDTLWDLADLYFNNPWYWPEIWYLNPHINNPHLIYPGEKVIIDPRKDFRLK